MKRMQYVGAVIAMALVAGIASAAMDDLSVISTLAGIKASTNSITARGDLRQIRISNATTPIAGMTETATVSVVSTDYGTLYSGTFTTNAVNVFPKMTAFDNSSGTDQLEFYTDGSSNIQGVASYIPLAGTVTLTVSQTSKGTNAYTVKADSTAQTSRSAGSAPTATQISNSATTWSCAEVIDRAGVTPDEAKQMGGIEKADEVGAKWAMRQVLAYREGLIAAKVLGTADDTFDPAKLRTDMQTALDTTRLYPGRTVLAASTYVLKAMVQRIAAEDGVGDAFARIVTGVNAAEAAMGLSFEAWKRGLALFLGVDDVLAGDDAVWNAGTYAGKFAVCKVDNSGDPLSHKWNPVFAKCFTFIPDGGSGWEVQAVADRTLINNFYDAKQWVNVVELNAAAVYVFDGVTA